MNKFWVQIALQALGYITSSRFIESTKTIVKSYIKEDAPGEVKRELAFEEIKALGYEASSWMISAAIELALGYFKLKYPQLFR